MKTMTCTIKKLIFLFLIFSSCGRVAQEHIDGEPEGKPEILWLNPSQIEMAGIQHGKISYREMGRRIYANGLINVPPGQRALITSMITGYIHKLHCLPGEWVQKGQPVAEINSLEFIEMQQEFQETSARLIYLKQEYERQRFLGEKDASSKKLMALAESEYRQHMSTLAGLAASLNLLGIDTASLSTGKVQNRLALYAPVSGFVNQVFAFSGMHLGQDEPVAEIIDNRQMHIELNVFEKDAMDVSVGQKVNFHLPNRPDEVFQGEIMLVSGSIEPENRSLQVRALLYPNQGTLKVGMYVNAEILIERSKRPVLPDKAINSSVDGNHVFYVVDQESENFAYAMMDVELDIREIGYTALRNADTTKLYVINGLNTLVNAFHEGSYDH
ncbi:MAG: efflux RND transporter periplasmic adaptor subunit [Cyclobacteriaceae bacterium]|nr:efflux RND transporter periplasmic adaptor subunit [Cyclobacteriaceae bacterium]